MSSLLSTSAEGNRRVDRHQSLLGIVQTISKQSTEAGVKVQALTSLVWRRVQVHF